MSHGFVGHRSGKLTCNSVLVQCSMVRFCVG